MSTNGEVRSRSSSGQLQALSWAPTSDDAANGRTSSAETESSRKSVSAIEKDIEAEETKEKPKGVIQFFKSMDRRKRWLLLYIGWIDFTNFGALAILAPFFPGEASKKGMSVAVSGFVFSCYAFVMTLASPVWGKLIPVFGTKNIITLGIFIDGICNIAFGLLDQVEDLDTFTALCFVVRGCEAIGGSAFFTGAFSLVADTFPEVIGTAMGTLEIFIGMGLSLGPAIGGFLYGVGGYGVPFWTIGGLMLINVGVTIVLLPKTDIKKRESGSMLHLLKTPSVLMVCLIVMSVSVLWMFLEPTLEPHLTLLGLSASQVGLFFFLLAAVYALACPVMGFISDKATNKWILMVFGMFGCALSFLLLGPSPYTFPFFDNTLWLNIVSLIATGIFFAAALLPTYEALMSAAVVDAEMPPGIATYGLVAGLWSCMWSLGEVVGPSVGGVLVQVFDFPIATSILALFMGIVGIVQGVFFSCKARRHRQREERRRAEGQLEDSTHASGLTTNMKESLSLTPSLLTDDKRTYHACDNSAYSISETEQTVHM